MHATSTMVDKKMQQVQAQMVQMSGGRAAMAPPTASGMPMPDAQTMEAMMQQSMQHLHKEQRAQMEQAMKNMRHTRKAHSPSRWCRRPGRTALL